MNRNTLLTLVLAVTSVLAVSCGGTAGAVSPTATPDRPSATVTPQAPTITDADSLIEALRAAGAKVESGETIDQPFFPVSGQVIKVNAQDVQVFVFADEAAAQAAALTVPSDGTSFKTMMVDWIAPPHFYRQGRLIALYVGSDAATIQLLTKSLGPQFAGR